MKVLRCGRAVYQPEIIFRRELEKPFDASARVLRTLTLIAVRE
jgi:hypothetical protein